MSGAQIAAEVAAAYKEAGVEAGNGNGAVMATITRTGTPTGASHSPTPGAPIDHVFTAKPMSVMAAQRAGMALESGERVYSLVNDGVTIAPTTADQVELDGETWCVSEVVTKDYAGYAITWLVKVKK